MDHIIEHEGQPIPDLSAVAESAGPPRDAMIVDEDDEDSEALKSLGAIANNAVEAKVRHKVWTGRH